MPPTCDLSERILMCTRKKESKPSKLRTLSLSSLAEESSEGNDEIFRCHLGCVHLTQVWEVNSMRWAFHLWWSMVIVIFFFSFLLSPSLSLIICIALPCLSLFDSITKSIFQYVKDRFSSPFFLVDVFIRFTSISSLVQLKIIEKKRRRTRTTTTTSSSMMFVHLCLVLNHSGEHSRLSLSPKKYRNVALFPFLIRICTRLQVTGNLWRSMTLCH